MPPPSAYKENVLIPMPAPSAYKENVLFCSSRRTQFSLVIYVDRWRPGLSIGLLQEARTVVIDRTWVRYEDGNRRLIKTLCSTEYCFQQNAGAECHPKQSKGCKKTADFGANSMV